ncbi:MAG: hypothetical protein ACI4SF_09465 [Oscillospiraceae bacterium]
MKNRILSLFAAFAVLLSLSACKPSNTSQQNEPAEQVNSETTLSAEKTLSEPTVKNTSDESSMDFWRSILSIKGEQITFPCTYADLEAALSKHGITVKPTGSYKNPDGRDTCFVDLYDGDTYFMAMLGTCESEDDLESYVFNGTLVTEKAKDYISINPFDPLHIGDVWENNTLGLELKKVGNNGTLSANVKIEDELYMCEVYYYIDAQTNTIENFSINVKNLGDDNNE